MFFIETSMYSDGINFPAVSIYFKGCDVQEKCKDCHNKQLWEFSIEQDNPENIIEAIEKEFLKLNKFYNKIAICFVGGEPLADKHIENVEKVSKYFKETYKGHIANIVYSWRYIEQIEKEKKMSKITNIDYIVCGKFDKEKYVNNFPASTNQYIYDLNKKTIIKKHEVK